MALPLICALIALVSLVSIFVLWPLIPARRYQDSESTDALARYELLLFERERVLDNLMELEADLVFEKLNVKDHAELKSDLIQEASEIYSEIENIEKND